MGAVRAAALATEFGFAVVGSLVGGIVVGQAIDRRLSTAPAFFLAGLVLGLIVSVYLMYVIYRIQVQPRRPARDPARRAKGGAPGVGQERVGAVARDADDRSIGRQNDQ